MKNKIVGFFLFTLGISHHIESEIIQLAHENPFQNLDGFSIPVNGGFNNAPEIASVIGYFKKKYNIHCAIETGTFYGQTTLCLSYLFDKVHTIEINPEYYTHAKNAIQSPNIVFHFGSSPDLLHKILPDLKNERILFYLDAHWENYWPLLDEIETINKTHHNNCIIIVDDIKVPGMNIKYDIYQGQELSYEYIKDKLNSLFDGYSYHYIIPVDHRKKAKLIAIPHKWRIEN